MKIRSRGLLQHSRLEGCRALCYTDPHKARAKESFRFHFYNLERLWPQGVRKTVRRERSIERILRARRPWWQPVGGRLKRARRGKAKQVEAKVEVELCSSCEACNLCFDLLFGQVWYEMQNGLFNLRLGRCLNKGFDHTGSLFGGGLLNLCFDESLK